MRTTPQIFISYAREDYETVEQLYNRLQYAGYKPWMDKKDILPGERWESSIDKAIRDSDFVLICISNKSVNKRGFLQREIKDALDLWREKLEDDIFLIPVRLEDCNVPESLKEFQWIDLYNSNEWILLLKAIHEGTKRLGIQNEILSPFGNIRLESERFFESNDSLPKYSIDVEYPKIEGLEDRASKEINTIIEGRNLEKIHRFKGDIYSSYHPPEKGDWPSTIPSELSATYEVSLLTDNLISLKINYYQYNSGAAHGMHWSISFNYQLRPLASIELFNMFRWDLTQHPLDIISRYCIADLKRQAKVDGYLEEGENNSWIAEDGAAPKPENFEVFNITKSSLIFTFIPYQVGPYAWGTRLVEISFSDIRDYLDKNNLIASLF